MQLKNLFVVLLLVAPSAFWAQTKVMPQQGGTGVDTSHSNGCAKLVNGTWTFSTGNCSAGPSGGITPAPQRRITFYTDPGTNNIVGGTNLTSDGNNLVVATSTSSPVVNGIFYPVGLVPDGTVCPTTIGSSCTYSGTDNTPAIQTSINQACAVNGGEVVLPGGTYNVINTAGAPRQSGTTTTNVAALTIPCSNVTLRGAGKGVTVLSFWVRSGGVNYRPTDVCPANPDFTPDKSYYSFPRTWRGSILYIASTQDSAHPRTGVVISDMTLHGNSVINRNSFNPVRLDPNFTSGAYYSQCNAWDTSFKGIYVQNNWFDPTTHPIGDGAYYPPYNGFNDTITINNVQIDHVLGEEIYSGDSVKNFIITNNTLTDTNGDGISVNGGQTILNNVIDNCAANGMENPVFGFPVQITGNHVSNCLSGINEIGFDYTQQNASFPPITITNNVLENIVANGLFLFDPVNMQVKHNSLTDCAWRGYNLDSSSCINLYANIPPFPVGWGPDGPTSTTAVAGAASSGTIPAGTYSYAVTWFTENNLVSGQTTGTCSSVTIPANGSVTVNAPSGTPPTGATGWYVYARTGSSCTSSLLPNLQLPNSVLGFSPYPLSQPNVVLTSLIAAGPNSPNMPWPNPGNTPNGFVVYPINPTNVDVQNNQITSNQGSISTGIGGFGAPNALTPIWSRNVNISSNKGTHLLGAAAVPRSAPTAPTLTDIAGAAYTFLPSGFPPGTYMLPAGTYYVKTTALWPECETTASPEATITVGANRQINVAANGLNGAPFFKVYMSTTSGNEIIQDNLGNSFTLSNNLYTQQYYLRTTADGNGYVPPPVTECSGTTFKTATGFPTAFNVAGNSPHARSTTIFNNQSTGTLAGAIENQAAISQTLTTTSDTTIASYQPVTEGNVQISFMYKVSNASTLINARVTYRAPDGSFPTYPLTAPELNTGSGQSVNGAWHIVTVPDITVTTGFPVSIVVTAGTANNIAVHGSISSKGMIQ